MILPAMSASTIAKTATPIETCAWCWPLLHPGEPYPESWSSTICASHEQWILERAQESRARRANAASASAREASERP